MAKLLTQKPNNLTIYPNSFERQEATPLDANSLFFSFESAQEYAVNNPVAYVGQLIVVITADKVTPYIISTENGQLQELGAKVNSDTGTKTFTSLDEITSEVLATLEQGQIITVVNENEATAYIVGYNSSAIYPVYQSVIPEEVASEATIDDILEGEYNPNYVTSNNTVKVTSIEDIVSGNLTYIEDDTLWPETSIKKDTIDQILES